MSVAMVEVMSSVFKSPSRIPSKSEMKQEDIKEQSQINKIRSEGRTDWRYSEGKRPGRGKISLVPLQRLHQLLDES
jgi:hypothetical protein